MSTESITNHQAEGPRQRGAREYFLLRGEYRNPYQPGSADFNDYERGWTQSLKRNEGQLVKMDAPPPPTAAPTSAPSSTYNRYAELKGRSGPRK